MGGLAVLNTGISYVSNIIRFFVALKAVSPGLMSDDFICRTGAGCLFFTP